ncbi:polysaccharide biosynthesis/export family protein [Puia sp.]|jgi:polysaccharide export outer membrane protein|uniref:polysaccharide biosynthesis/export family protein n=1 Tax=Puia sp. TaxID=2045100 RepID=UPI002F3EE3CC
MMMTRMLPLLIVTVFGVSCISSKKTAYFSNQGPAEIISSNQAPKPMIEINDLLSITVTSLSPQASSEYNIPNTVGFTSLSYNSAISPVSGYLVGPDGFIKFPRLGKIRVVDLTPVELEEWLTSVLLEEGSLKQPLVTVRHLNFKVTVLGEVARPAVFNIPNARISLLEAIGMAGDMTIYGRRDNVLLIREENKKKVTVRINLNSSDLLNSPYYYLKTNDVVYIEPNGAKVSSATRAQNLIPIVFSALSFAVIALDILSR